MKKVLTCTQMNDLLCVPEFIEEVLIETRELSRKGKLSCLEVLGYLDQLTCKVILQCDLLLNESDFERLEKTLSQFPVEKIHALRVCDAGMISFLKVYYPQLKIHLNLESHSHNLLAIKSWVESSKQIERVVLSVEIPKQRLEMMIRELSVEVEVLGHGPLLLFYSPRSLISPHFTNSREVLVESHEMTQKNFKILENQHGTMMFHSKFWNILEFSRELESQKLHALRIDPYGLDQASLQNLFDWIEDSCEKKLEKFIHDCPRPCSRGYFLVNKSDALFSKLKNNDLVPGMKAQEDCYLGEVVDVVKKSHVAIHLKGREGLQVGQTLNLFTPDKKHKQFVVKHVYDTMFRLVPNAQPGDIILIPHVSGTSVRTQVYR